MQYVYIFLVQPGEKPRFCDDHTEELVRSALEQVRQLKPGSPSTDHRAFEENCRRFQLTNREIEIAKWACQGLSYRDIGSRLFISKRTVGKHMQHVFEKLGVANKIELTNLLRVS